MGWGMGLGSELNSVREFGGGTSAIVLWGRGVETDLS